MIALLFILFCIIFKPTISLNNDKFIIDDQQSCFVGHVEEFFIMLIVDTVARTWRFGRLVWCECVWC